MTIHMEHSGCLVLHHRSFKQFPIVGNLGCFPFFNTKNSALKNVLKKKKKECP